MAKHKPYVLAVVGSFRKKGNCDTLCDRALAGMKSAGASVEKIYLSDLDIRPCRGCDACQGKGGGACAVEDDMRDIYPKLKACDVLVLATPTYFFNMSAQMKVFVDRLYPLSTPKKFLLGARRAVVCITYGADDVLLSGAPNTVRTFSDIFAFINIPVNFVHASAWKKGDIRKNRQALERAYDVGREAATGEIHR